MTDTPTACKATDCAKKRTKPRPNTAGAINAITVSVRTSVIRRGKLLVELGMRRSYAWRFHSRCGNRLILVAIHHFTSRLSTVKP